MKLNAKLKSFKKYFGMTAELLNNDGDVIDTITIGEDGQGKKLKFKFDRADLNGSNKVEIVFEDNNGDNKNFEKGDDTYDMNPDDQDFDVTIKSNKKAKAKVKLKGDKLSGEIPSTDTTGPVFTSGATATASETITAGTTVYTATATDDSPPISFSLSGTDAGSFSISAQGQVSINAAPDFETKSSYSFNVVGTDAAGNSSTQAVVLTITDVAEGQTIPLTVFQDVYDANTGTTVNANGVQTERAERLTTADDTITANAGTFGIGANNNDSLTDPSTSDNDTLQLTTNTTNNLQASLTGITNLTNTENLDVTATNDNSTLFNFANVTELQSLDINGLFTTNVTLQNFIDNALINNFDFSGSTNTAIGFTVNNANNTVQVSTEAWNFVGSPGADNFEANIGAATMLGGNGADTMRGSDSNSTYMAGQAGIDTLTLEANNAAPDTISYQTITTATNANNVTGFVGFLDPAANAAQTHHDKLEFDDDTVTNFTANSTIQQKTFAQLQNLLGTAAADNHILVDGLTAIETADLSVHGKSWVALSNDQGGAERLFFSQDGNFAANRQQIGLVTIENANGAFFLSDQQVTVV